MLKSGNNNYDSKMYPNHATFSNDFFALKNISYFVCVYEGKKGIMWADKKIWFR